MGRVSKPLRLKGWDHYSAVMLLFGLLVAVLVSFMPLGSLLGGRPLAVLIGATFLLAALAVPFLTYEVTVDDGQLIVRRRVLLIPYARDRVEASNAWVKVIGTGDWGEEGDWPAKRYCMIGQQRPYTHGTRIGSPTNAHCLEQVLKVELQRIGATGARA